MSLTLEFVKKKSAARLAGLHEVVRIAAERLIERAYNAGVPIVITQGLRTIQEQNELYAQGRTKPGQRVTNAKGGYSFHNFGVAIDFALLLPDGKSVSWDMRRDGNGNKKADWQEVARIGKDLGFEWGGDWTSFKDYPHFQMTFGLTTAQYRAGQKPTEAAKEKALAKINEEVAEPMTAQERKEFDELRATVKAQAAKIKKLESRESMEVPKWAEPAVNAAHQAGLIDTKEGGSLAFYRILTVLHRNGMLITKGE